MSHADILDINRGHIFRKHRHKNNKKIAVIYEETLKALRANGPARTARSLTLHDRLQCSSRARPQWERQTLLGERRETGRWYPGAHDQLYKVTYMWIWHLKSRDLSETKLIKKRMVFWWQKWGTFQWKCFFFVLFCFVLFFVLFCFFGDMYMKIN